MVTRICMVHCGNEEDAKDCFQNVFIKLFRSWITFENEAHLKAWLIKVTLNECNDWYRKSWNHKVVLMDDISPYIHGEDTQEEDQVLPYLMQLSYKYRQALYCFYYENMKINEIAEQLHLSENTVKSHLTRGRKELEKCMRKSEKFQTELSDVKHDNRKEGVIS